jgi:hypothetical protein
VTRRATTSGREAGKGGGEACCCPGNPERRISSLDQTISKTPKVIKTKEKVMTKWGGELTGWRGWCGYD